MNPAHLDLAISQLGKLHDGPDVVRLAREIGQAGEMDYWDDAAPDTAWCGIFVAWCLVKSGFDVRGMIDSKGVGLMYVDRYLDYGTSVPVSQRQPGDIAIYRRPGLHHVNFVADEGDCVGGNQVGPSGNPDSVTRKTYPTPDAVRRPVKTGAVQLQPVSSNFDRVHPIIAKWEGGFSNDAADPGGATKYGITIGRLSEARGHSVAIADVQALEYSEALAIFRRYYWEPLRCDDLQIALALMTYNAGVNSGPDRGARFLQQTLNRQGAGLEEDGEIGPLTIAAAQRANVAQAVKDYSATYEAFYRSLLTFGTFGRGWLNRLNDVTTMAASWAVTRKTYPTPDASKPVGPVAADPLLMLLALLTGKSPMADIDLSKITKIVGVLQNPTLQKLLSNQPVTLQELLSIGPAIEAVNKVPALPPPTEAPAAPSATTPALERPSVALSAIAAAGTWLAQIGGALPPGLGPKADTVGQLLTAAPLISGVLGGMGTWGAVAKAGLSVLSFILSKAQTR